MGNCISINSFLLGSAFECSNAMLEKAEGVATVLHVQNGRFGDFFTVGDFIWFFRLPPLITPEILVPATLSNREKKTRLRIE